MKIMKPVARKSYEKPTKNLILQNSQNKQPTTWKHDSQPSEI